MLMILLVLHSWDELPPLKAFDEVSNMIDCHRLN